MDIQRTVLWVVFGMSLVFLWDRWLVYQGKPSLLMPFTTAPAPAGAPTTNSANPSAPSKPATTATDVPTDVAPAAAAAPSAADVPATAPVRAAAPIQDETDLLEVEIDPVGGVVVHAQLRAQPLAPDWTAAGLVSLFTGKKQDPNKRVVLFENAPGRLYVAQTGILGAAGAPNHTTTYRLRDDGGAGTVRSLAPGQDSVALALVAEGGGLRVTKSFVFHRGRYDVEVTHEIENLGTAPVTPSVYLQLKRDGNKVEGENGMYYTYTGPAIYTDADKFKKISFSDIDKDKERPASTLSKKADNGWVAMIQHYFVSAWVPPAKAEREYFARSPERNVYTVGTVLPQPALAAGAKTTVTSALYIGPQDQDALEKLAPGLDFVVDYGWLSPLAKPLFWLLQKLHGLIGNWGWAVVLLTVLVKAALYPLSKAGYQSMARMKELTPRLTKLREQHGEDRQKFQQAMMELYQREKINPLTMTGCLPMLAQMPVFLALYWTLLASVELRNAPWLLWIRDLATPDPWFVLPVIMMGTMFLQYKLNPKPPDPMQARIMAIMPFAFGIMFFMFPAGLVLYWIVNNVLSIGQQWWVNKQIEKAKKPG